jgi:crossover junction endodeoxyribonuclease RusA
MIAFTVYGRPQPQGSSRAFRTKGGKTVLTSDNKQLRSWRQDLAVSAKKWMNENRAFMVKRPAAVALSAEFYFARPVSLAKKVTAHTKRPDVDKLLRGLKDGLTGICFEDDSQVNQALIQKRYGSPERTEIKIFTSSQALLGYIPPLFQAAQETP